jgi:SAM-dependent methyltransferase
MPLHDVDDADVRTLAQMTGVATQVARPLLTCVTEEVPANIALMQLCMAADSASEVEWAISAGEGLWGDDIPPLAELRALWSGTPDAFRLIKGVVNAVDGLDGVRAYEDELADCAAGFDKAAALSPEASVALYSLGSPALLAQATSEIVERMQEWGLLAPEKSALEIGCGNGRFLRALAPFFRSITGIDISAAMIAAARERCRDLSNIEARQTDGRSLAAFADACFELILAADSLPYIVRCGADLTRHHFEETARVLKPGGHFLILNFSYRGNLDDDRAEVMELAAITGFAVLRDGTRDFRLWDGASFLLSKSA